MPVCFVSVKRSYLEWQLQLWSPGLIHYTSFKVHLLCPGQIGTGTQNAIQSPPLYLSGLWKTVPLQFPQGYTLGLLFWQEGAHLRGFTCPFLYWWPLFTPEVGDKTWNLGFGCYKFSPLTLLARMTTTSSRISFSSLRPSKSHSGVIIQFNFPFDVSFLW